MRVLTDRFHIGQGTQIGPITAFPVWTEAKLSISYDTTPVATLQVSELDSPTIENLNIASTHPLPVLLPEGTVLDGGMQTRVELLFMHIRKMPDGIEDVCLTDRCDVLTFHG